MKGLSIVLLLCYSVVVIIADNNEELLKNFDLQAYVRLCDVCQCIEESKEIHIECVQIKEITSLDKILWPQSTETINGSAYFEGMGLSSIQKLPKNDVVTSLRIINNGVKNIWPSAFANLKSLKSLSLSYNVLNKITPDMFLGLETLEELDLSSNELEEFNQLDFQNMASLKLINLSENQLKNVPFKALEKLTKLEYLNLSHNKIYFLEFGTLSEQMQYLTKLKILDISYNKIVVVVKETFQQMHSLEVLNLSNNEIKNIDSHTFENCKELKSIDLSSNDIFEMKEFPLKVEVLNLHNNHFKEWPLFPANLKVLDFSANELYRMFNDNEMFLDKLQFLNVSSNQLQNFELTQPLMNLKTLDVSNNAFQRVPKYFNEFDIPALESLYLDGNPIEELVFDKQLSLNMLSINRLNKITIIKKLNIASKPKDDSCLKIFASYCDQLQVIDEEAFSNITICYLDISHNNLTTLSKNVANWTSIKYGVNMQNNPWECNCNLQWVLDDLLDFFYKKHSVLLHELRCRTPRHYRGLRFVHWYKRKEKAFCEIGRSRKSADYVVSQSSEGPFGENDVLVIVLFVLIIIGIIILAALITYLVRGKYRQNRRMEEIMKRKRQTINDMNTEKANGQNVALTGV